jgi:hypothetical protein
VDGSGGDVDKVMDAADEGLVSNLIVSQVMRHSHNGLDHSKQALTNSKIYQVFSASYPEAAISTTRNLTVL